MQKICFKDLHYREFYSLERAYSAAQRIKHILRKLTIANNVAVSAEVRKGIGIKYASYSSKIKLRIISIETRSKYIENTLLILKDNYFNSRLGL